MSEFALLRWIEENRHTEAQAKKSGRDNKTEWDVCLFRGWFSIEEDGRLVLTEAGVAELSMMRTLGG